MGWLDRLDRCLRGAPSPRALVVGAGVAGLTSALLLDARGIRTSVLERLPTRRARTRSVVLSDAELSGYDSIGLMGMILRASSPFAHRVLDVGRGSPGRRPRIRAGARVLPHAELLEILEEEAESRWLPVERGKDVLSVGQTPAEAYAVVAGGRRETATYVVAADGAGSVAGSAFGAPRARRRVRSWSISGRSRVDLLAEALGEEVEPGAAVMASAEHMDFMAQRDDPADEDTVAWSIRLLSAEGIDLSAVTSEVKKDQIISSLRGLERLAPSVLPMVRGSHEVAVVANADDPGRLRGAGRIVVTGSAHHGDHSSPLAAPAPYLGSIQVPDRIAAFQSASA